MTRRDQRECLDRDTRVDTSSGASRLLKHVSEVDEEERYTFDPEWSRDWASLGAQTKQMDGASFKRNGDLLADDELANGPVFVASVWKVSPDDQWNLFS